jgi:hypothetical protein
MKKPWMNSELKLLKDLWHTRLDDDAAALIGRSKQSCKAVAKRRIARHRSLSQNVASVFMANRVIDAHGPNVKKVSFSEYSEMFMAYTQAHREGMEDPQGFRPASTYVSLLLNKPDGTPRERPLRRLLQNEVGMVGDVICVLKDAGPDDVGEGKYHQVHANTPVGEKP